jgi:hypothetical protein
MITLKFEDSEACEIAHALAAAGRNADYNGHHWSATRLHTLSAQVWSQAGFPNHAVEHHAEARRCENRAVEKDTAERARRGLT